jgi:hypothetical protein
MTKQPAQPLLISSSAVISKCGTYRYLLTRQVSSSSKIATFIMLNPSTADAVNDDQTIRKCIGFTKLFGSGQLRVVNLFAIRSRDPKVIRKAIAPVGKKNADHIKRAVVGATYVICAWGVGGNFKDQDLAVVGLLNSLGVNAFALAITRGGHPQHPLMASYSREMVPYAGKASRVWLERLAHLP